MVPVNVRIQAISSLFEDETGAIGTSERFSKGRSNRFNQRLLCLRVHAQVRVIPVG